MYLSIMPLGGLLFIAGGSENVTPGLNPSAKERANVSIFQRVILEFLNYNIEANLEASETLSEGKAIALICIAGNCRPPT